MASTSHLELIAKLAFASNFAKAQYEYNPRGTGDEQSLTTRCERLSPHICLSRSARNEHVLIFPSLHLEVVCKADLVSSTRCNSPKQAASISVQQKLIPTETETPELYSESHSDQAIIERTEQIKDEMHPQASLIRSMYLADELSSKRMLDQLRKGAYDAIISSERGSLGTTYPWTRMISCSHVDCRPTVHCPEQHVPT